MIKHKYSILFVLFLLFAFMTYSCGGKKTETTDTNKKETQTQTTQKMDTTKPKTDTASTKTDTTTSSKESDKVILETSLGNMTIELYPKDAPQHVANFKKLVKSKFFEGTTFHRVIAGFMIQGGDPNSKDDDRSNDGQGGPGYTIPAEISRKHEKGAVASARLGDAMNPKRESSGSQFYIVTGEASHLNGQYTVFGKVIKGMDVADKIEKVKKDANDNPIEKIVIKKIYFAE